MHNKVNDFPFFYKVLNETTIWYNNIYSLVFSQDFNKNSKEWIIQSVLESASEDDIKIFNKKHKLNLIVVSMIN